MKGFALAVLLAACSPSNSASSSGGSAAITLSGTGVTNAKTTSLTGGLDIFILAPTGDAGTGKTVVVLRTIGDAYFFHPYVEIDIPGTPVAGMTYNLGNDAKVILAEDMDKIPPRDWTSTSGTITVDSVTTTGLGLRFNATLAPDTTMPGNGATGTFTLSGTVLAAAPSR